MMKTSPLSFTALLPLLAASSTLLHGAIATNDSTAPHTAAKNNNHVIDAASASASSSASSSANNDESNEILAALTTQTNKSTIALSEKSAEYTKLQSLLSDKLADFREHMLQQADDTTTNNNAIMDGTISTEAMYESMDEVSLKLVALMKRTEDLTKKIGQFNRAELLGSSSSQKDNNSSGGGLQERMMNVKQDEIERRDRFVASLMMAQKEHSGDDDAESENNEIHANDDEEEDYITITQLDQLLSTDEIIAPSDNELKVKLTALAMDMMEQRTSEEEEFWKNHFATLPQTIQEHVVKQQQHQLQQQQNSGGDGCINIPSAVQLVANALNLHYQDGGVGMADIASYENGGSVVYELTSAPYQPSPRNNERREQQQEGFGVDKATEQMYHEQQQNDLMMMMNSGDGGGGVGIAQKIDMELDKIDMWDWYTHFQLDSIRKYLPDDWERVLDRLSASGYLGMSTNNWGEYTPRGIVDAIIPDYIYHAFSISNTASYGSVYGRTASPEVVITAGHSKVGGGGTDGGGGGWSAKPLGNCYPLSMRPENDPVLSLLSRDTPSMGAEGEMDDEEDESENTSLLVGPKYTVRLPYPIQIDAVSIEHRAFPLPRNVLNDGVRGGESAPRWVRVIGFPPCYENIDDSNDVEVDEEECDKFGFDISQPIELGSFEYYPVTVSGREDDYGRGDDIVDETSTPELDGRRRSVQTFVVKGGKVNESVAEEIGGDDDIPNNNEPEFDAEDYDIPAGSCVPPKEPDDVPSCGGGATSSSSDQSERQVVSAVSFIIEENWGNNEYTCLYGVRVHGDIAV